MRSANADGRTLTRRSFSSIGLSGLAAASVGGCHSDDAARGRIEILAEPRLLQLHPLSRFPLSSSELQNAARLLLPLDLGSYPFGYTFHAIRFWGIGADFGTDVPSLFSFDDGKWGRAVFQSLVDNERFREVTADTGRDLLLDSEFGVHARCADDGGFASRFVTPHAGGYVSVMADLGVSASQRVVTAQGSERSLHDAIVDEAKRANLMLELEWVVTGLVRYLKSPFWKNRYQNEISFDSLLEELITRTSRSTLACNGTHLPYALACAYSVSAEGLISRSTRQRIENELIDLSSRLAATRRDDGLWDEEWNGVAASNARSAWSSRGLDNLSITGHVLEFLSILPHGLRPNDSAISHSCEAVYNAMLTNRVHLTDWHVHAPYSHCAKALIGLNGFRYGSQIWDGDTFSS